MFQYSALIALLPAVLYLRGEIAHKNRFRDEVLMMLRLRFRTGVLAESKFLCRPWSIAASAWCETPSRRAAWVMCPLAALSARLIKSASKRSISSLSKHPCQLFTTRAASEPISVPCFS